MTLSEYLAQPGKTAVALASELGVAVSTITRTARFESNPPRWLMAAIIDKTDGLVTADELIRQPGGDERERAA